MVKLSPGSLMSGKGFAARTSISNDWVGMVSFSTVVLLLGVRFWTDFSHYLLGGSPGLKSGLALCSVQDTALPDSLSYDCRALGVTKEKFYILVGAHWTCSLTLIERFLNLIPPRLWCQKTIPQLAGLWCVLKTGHVCLAPVSTGFGFESRWCGGGLVLGTHEIKNARASYLRVLNMLSSVHEPNNNHKRFENSIVISQSSKNSYTARVAITTSKRAPVLLSQFA
ncbi:hypothetical protein CEXT_519241 [Caerostris extrusa]|uniref:Uncharacterized protein n=1 Tax=Caerostris extrusa TaxID=172846 RepID=A0AAV4RJW6_CAEEX|nr:hypothetical protein CEXT_519241 [Caerostris extrusa]